MNAVNKTEIHVLKRFAADYYAPPPGTGRISAADYYRISGARKMVLGTALVWCNINNVEGAYLITLVSICMIWMAVVGPSRGSYRGGKQNTTQGHTGRQQYGYNLLSLVFIMYTPIYYIMLLELINYSYGEF